MKLSHKIVLGMMAGTCVLTASAAELFKAKTADDFLGKPSLVVGNGVMTFCDGDRVFQSAKTFQIDPAKTYKISGSFALRSGKGNPIVYLGFVCIDKDGNRITPQSIFIYPSSATLTELAAPVKKGDKVIKVKDASQWKADTTYRGIVFNAKADMSDLPNNTILYIEKDGIVKNGNVWVIKLQKPAGEEYAAGTMVREQTAGSTYSYAKYTALKDGWNKLEGKFKGISRDGDSRIQFWPCTKSVRVLIATQNMKKGMSIDFKDVILEEAK